MRFVATAAVASVVALIAGSCQPGLPGWPELIPEEDLVPPAQLEGTLQPVAGWVMAATTSHKVSGELPLTHAETTYSSGDTVIKVELTDSGMIARAFASLMAGYEEEIGNSRGASTNIAGIPAVENWYGTANEGTLSLLVANRFVVSITARDIEDISVLRDFATKLDTTRLTALRGYPST